MLTTKAANYGKNSLLWWKIIGWLLWGVLVAGVIGSLYFIYVYIYQTLNEANTVVTLNLNSSVNTLQLDDYDKVKQLIDSKQNTPGLPTKIRNIFFYTSSTPAIQKEKLMIATTTIINK